MTLLQESDTAAGVAMDAALKRSILLCLAQPRATKQRTANLLIRVRARHSLGLPFGPF